MNLALQFATSDPKGPLYLMGAREVIEEDIQPYEFSQPQWSPVVTGLLPESAVADIVTPLVEAERPLVVVGFTGRNPDSVPELIRLTDLIKGLKIHDSERLICAFHSATGHMLAIRRGPVQPSELRTSFWSLTVTCHGYRLRRG